LSGSVSLKKRRFMFGFFKKKSEKEKLTEKYNKLLKEAFELSSVDRKASDAKQSEANDLWKQIEQLSS